MSAPTEQEEDAAYEAWLTALAKECECCPNCCGRPCGGCQQGAPCDAMRCLCWDERDYDMPLGGDEDED